MIRDCGPPHILVQKPIHVEPNHTEQLTTQQTISNLILYFATHAHQVSSIIISLLCGKNCNCKIIMHILKRHIFEMRKKPLNLVYRASPFKLRMKMKWKLSQR